MFIKQVRMFYETASNSLRFRMKSAKVAAVPPRNSMQSLLVEFAGRLASQLRHSVSTK